MKWKLFNKNLDCSNYKEVTIVTVNWVRFHSEVWNILDTRKHISYSFIVVFLLTFVKTTNRNSCQTKPWRFRQNQVWTFKTEKLCDNYCRVTTNLITFIPFSKLLILLLSQQSLSIMTINVHYNNVLIKSM